MSQIIKKFYNEHPNFGIYKARRRKINNLVNSETTTNNKKILDIGCATGYLSVPFKKLGNHVVGIDISDKSIAEARQKLDKAYVVDIENYPWPDEVVNRHYDVILATELIEHLFMPEKFLSYIKPLLTPIGAVVITTPNFLMWSDRVKMMLGYYKVKDKGHIRLFSYKTLKKLITDSGFKIVKSDHSWKPQWLESFSKFLSPNLFTYQIIIKIKKI